MYLHAIDQLQSSVLKTACSLLVLIQQARRSNETSLEWMGEKIKLSTEHAGICFSSISFPLSLPDYVVPPVLPGCLVEAFRPCSVHIPDKVEILKVLFATHQFENASGLAESLHTFCRALEQLSKPLPPHEATSTDSATPPADFLSLNWLEMIVSLSQKHMKEFYSLGVLSDEDLAEEGGPPTGEGLHAASMVYSEISGSTRASLRGPGRSLEGNGEEEDVAQQKVLQRQSLEEFSLVLALKNSVLCSVCPGSREYGVIVRLTSDLFPSCDVEGLLAHETGVREGLAIQAKENRGVVESARESRAASVMQMMREDGVPNESE